VQGDRRRPLCNAREPTSNPPDFQDDCAVLFDYIEQSNFVPIAIVPNKLLCCRPSKAVEYRDFLRSAGTASLWRRDIELSNYLVDLHANWMTAEQFSDAVATLTTS
jgi:hypothetical protein